MQKYWLGRCGYMMLLTQILNETRKHKFRLKVCGKTLSKSTACTGMVGNRADLVD